MKKISLTAGTWNAAIVERGGSFLQSWEWGEFQRSFGRHIKRFSNSVFFGQAIVQPLPYLGFSLYIPRGPVGPWAELEFDDWLTLFRHEDFSKQAMFMRIDPPRQAHESILQRNGFRDIGFAVQPKQNLIIELWGSEEELLSKMHEKTRYNIRLALKRGVEVLNPKSEILNNTKIQNPNFETFYSLLQETGKRQKMRLHSRKYYEKMFETILELPVTGYQLSVRQLRRRFYIASYQGKPLATALVIYFGNRATYIHGGSSLEHKNTMAPDVLHWKIIQDARTLGFSEYDMGGIDVQRWPGLTRFKNGFGGKSEHFMNAHDLSLQRFRYRTYRIARRVRP